ncbi:uncharacterized protein BT62DRAFT_972783 [Guyanagaster necrorhizus]|uniref:Cell wall mannoprotein n=1 Tax=Guyanagaster necrorhizus TaxID=856835 RepID=A0A9P7VLW8_9AGAR|nr:uncharacterized protein BT62DRAFT_972783 [Guyanagaster necrorhizus MCA 3950]KAG7443027.1 hypothetical protein BT62DRAFT_972783 [Guyanagaster necrorhizus MCA 3950]
MISSKTLFALGSLSVSALALPIYRREVPQEHSHEQFLTTVGASLALNNPDNITDPVFGLLGNAAAIAGAGNIADATCLQQATADQAFTNAKAAGDVDGMVAALIYRALERNSGSVGATTDACTSIQAVNPEIAAIQQHQDPASDNAAAVNKAIVLELAQQIAAVGGNAQDALKSGTFAPGKIGDPTAAGNTCDDANDPVGCIFTQNLLVEDATADEIDAAATGGTSDTTDDSSNASGAASADSATSTADATSATATVAARSDSTATASAAAGSAADTTGTNLQTFTGALGGIAAPAVTAGGRGFVVEGSDDFLNVGAALTRSCSIQHNACADAANSGSADITVGDCDEQSTECEAAA